MPFLLGCSVEWPLTKTLAHCATVSAPDSLPAKVKISPASIMTLDMAATFKIKVKGAAKSGSYQLEFSGRDDSGRSASVTVTLVVQ